MCIRDSFMPSEVSISVSNDGKEFTELKRMEHKVVTVSYTHLDVYKRQVLEVGTTNGTITDVDGNFTIQVPVGAKLEVSYIGYKTQQLSLIHI